MASITTLIFPNFPKRPETGTPVFPELPAAPIRGGVNGNGIGSDLLIHLEGIPAWH